MSIIGRKKRNDRVRLGKNQDHAGKDMACLSEFDLLNDASAVFFIIVQTQAVPGMNEQYFRGIICGCFNGIYAAFRFQTGVPCACTAMAGDAENDMLFAENRGLIGILYRPSEKKEKTEHADYVIYDFKELLYLPCFISNWQQAKRRRMYFIRTKRKHAACSKGGENRFGRMFLFLF